ncbi:MAG: hypothetical protein ACI4MU_05005 [Candidatus Ventricola sp.]
MFDMMNIINSVAFDDYATDLLNHYTIWHTRAQDDRQQFWEETFRKASPDGMPGAARMAGFPAVCRTGKGGSGGIQAQFMRTKERRL